jgi:hypothetical protein
MSGKAVVSLTTGLEDTETVVAAAAATAGERSARVPVKVRASRVTAVARPVIECQGTPRGGAVSLSNGITGRNRQPVCGAVPAGAALP